MSSSEGWERHCEVVHISKHVVHFSIIHAHRCTGSSNMLFTGYSMQEFWTGMPATSSNGRSHTNGGRLLEEPHIQPRSPLRTQPRDIAFSATEGDFQARSIVQHISFCLCSFQIGTRWYWCSACSQGWRQPSHEGIRASCLLAVSVFLLQRLAMQEVL